MSWDSERVRQLRQRLQMTQNEMAQYLGCRQQTISEWEKGLYAPANAYGKLLDQLGSQVRLNIHLHSSENRQNHGTPLKPMPPLARAETPPREMIPAPDPVEEDFGAEKPFDKSFDPAID